MDSENKKGLIRNLKDKLREQELSFVIGAGFSKNVSEKFLDWKGLLKDMILEIYDSYKKWSKTIIFWEEYKPIYFL
ncbi:MAG: hypothetical protein ABFC90_08360 [Bacteroidales bacterium]|nr:hypothetical protein [Bacteroidales bacterium]